MAKALTQSDIKSKAERWATHTRKIESLEAEREKELAPLEAAYVKKIAPIHAKYDALVDPLQEKADEIETTVLDWLAKQKRSVKIESRKAVAEFVKGKKLGNRVVDAGKFMKLAAERKIKDFMKLVRVTIKDAESVLGKDDMNEVCDRPEIKSEIATLSLKD